MVLKGLEKVGKYRMAYEIAENHLRNVVEVFRNTGTVWENYAPEKAVPGNPAKSDFVGWTGLTPIAVLFEYVFGIRADSRKNQITWDVIVPSAMGCRIIPSAAARSICSVKSVLRRSRSRRLRCAAIFR